MLSTSALRRPGPISKKYAIVFGVQLRHWGVSGCDNTGRLAGWILTNIYGFDPSNVMTFINMGVTRQNILQAANWLVSVADEGSTAVFFYSGHGTYDPVANDSYISTVDTMNGLVMASELRAIFSNLRSRKVLIVVDACFSGYWLTPMAAPNRIVISGAGFSYGIDGKHYTYFGGFFLDQAIRKKLGDANHDGVVSVEEAWNYVKIGMINDQYPGDMIL